MAPTTIPFMDQNLQLHYFTLSENESNGTIIARMRNLSTERSSTTSAITKQFLYALLMREFVVGKGIVLKVGTNPAQHHHLFPVDKANAPLSPLTSKLSPSLPVVSTKSKQTIR